MSNPLAVILSILIAGALAFGAMFLLLRAEPPTRPASPVGGDQAVARQLDRLAERLDGIERQLAARADAAPARQRAEVPTRADVERWIAEAISARGDADGGGAGREFAVDAAVAQLVEVGVNRGEESAAIWDEARKSGKVKELIAAFERRAQEMPNSADAQADLGDAYVQGIIGATDMLSQSTFAQQADEAYDAALALDDTHWRARLSKATGLTFWPDFLGKKAEAIENFETLATQQESSSVRPEYLQTWLSLGNLYSQQGKDELARKTWERGLRQFPDDPQLRDRLGR